MIVKYIHRQYVGAGIPTIGTERLAVVVHENSVQYKLMDTESKKMYWRLKCNVEEVKI